MRASTARRSCPCCSCTPETLTARDRAGSAASQGFSSVQPSQQDLGADLHDQAAALGGGDELLRRDQDAVALPAGQRLDLDHGAQPGRDDRLVVHGDLAAVDGGAQPGLQVGALEQGGHHFRPETQVAVLAGGLGRVHGDVGAAEQLGGVDGVLADGRQPQAQAGPQHGAVDPDRHLAAIRRSARRPRRRRASRPAGPRIRRRPAVLQRRWGGRRRAAGGPPRSASGPRRGGRGCR